MTNEIIQSLKKIGKILFILFLMFVASAVFNTFLKFSNLEKRLAAQDMDYLNPDGPSGKEAPVPSEKLDLDALIMGDGSNYSLGTDNPKITIVEFADFACPYCKKSFSRIREISLTRNQDVKYIFRDLPIVKEYSPILALAARCAGEQGLFWLMHDRLFIKQGIQTKAEITEVAKQSGADIPKFTACLDSQKFLPQIQKDYSDALTLGLDKIGTPVWYINGQQVSGDIPEETFTQIIDSVLKK